jgi:hypothetical protein
MPVCGKCNTKISLQHIPLKKVHVRKLIFGYSYYVYTTHWEHNEKVDCLFPQPSFSYFHELEEKEKSTDGFGLTFEEYDHLKWYAEYKFKIEAFAGFGSLLQNIFHNENMKEEVSMLIKYNCDYQSLPEEVKEIYRRISGQFITGIEDYKKTIS